MSTQKQVDRIITLAKMFNNAKVLVEENNIGITLFDYLKENNIHVEKFYTSAKSKYSIDEGILFLVNQFENHQIIIPRRGEKTRELTDALLNELSNFGETDSGKFQSMGEHDDMVMSLWLANKATQRRKGLFVSKTI
jgi:hypothetical protein